VTWLREDLCVFETNDFFLAISEWDHFLMVIAYTNRSVTKETAPNQNSAPNITARFEFAACIQMFPQTFYSFQIESLVANSSIGKILNCLLFTVAQSLRIWVINWECRIGHNNHCHDGKENPNCIHLNEQFSTILLKETPIIEWSDQVHLSGPSCRSKFW